MLLLWLFLATEPCEPGRGLVIDAAHGTVSFDGTLHPNRYNGLLSFPKHHHLIVFEEGRAARNALIVTDVPDREIGAALASIGAVAGNNLTRATWEARGDPNHPDPDLRVKGTALRVWFCFSEGEAVGPERLLTDRAGKGFDFRFGGHEDLIPIWRSGCVVCLESCPGARVSNAAYTLRDLAEGRARFDEVDDLPAAGTRVRVVLQIAEQP